MNVYDKSGWTPLLRAAYYGQEKVARGLIRGNADVHLKVRGESRSVPRTVAYYICWLWLKLVSLINFIVGSYFGSDAARQLVKFEKDMYIKVRGSGRTVLHVAAYYGHLALVKLFLETNVGINEQDDGGMTALMLAVERGHSAVVAELMKAGADTRLEGKKGTTAILLAKSYVMVFILAGNVHHLSKRDRSFVLWHACDGGDLSMVKAVIEEGCDVDHIHKGQTPVMMATLRGHDKIVKELVLANCNVNYKNDILLRDWALANDLAATIIKPKTIYWMAAVVCILLPCQWTKFQTDMAAILSIDPVWGSVLLAILVLAAVCVTRMMSASWTVMLRSVIAAILIILALEKAMLAGLVPWGASIMVAFAMPFVRRRPKDTIAAVTDHVGTIMLFTLVMCTVLAMTILVPVILAWSPRDVITARTEVVAGGLVITAIIIVLLKRVEPAWEDNVLALLKGVIINVELFVMASAYMMIDRKTYLHHENPAAQTIEGLLTTFILFMGFLLLVLRVQTTAVVLCRGAILFLVFEATKLLQMEGALVSLDKPHIVLVVLVIGMAEILTAAYQNVTLFKGMVVTLHLVVAVAEAYLALLISKEGVGGLQIGTVNWEQFVNLSVVAAMVLSIEDAQQTVLHYAASYSRPTCGAHLVEAGADKMAKNRFLRNPLEMESEVFKDEMQKVLSFTTKRVIAVIGNSECGKSTLVAALKCKSSNLWKKVINYFKKVHDIRQRTTGIAEDPLSSPKYGDALIYDFAGQSQYHGPHHPFLEALLSKRDVSATLILLVKANDKEDIITQQFHYWLQPLGLMSIPVTLQVIVVGSFFDQVKSKKEASEKLLRCMQLAKTEVPLKIEWQGPCLLDCHHPESRGINQVCRYLEDAPPMDNVILSVSYNLHWVFVQLRKECKKTALSLKSFQLWLEEKNGNLPKDLPSPEELCQDFSAAGYALFLPNKQDPSQSWLILDPKTLLHHVYGTLFNESQGKENIFGLLHRSYLADLFKELDLEMIQEVLCSLELCTQVDPLILKEELSELTGDKEGVGWLYFPALVSAQPCNVFPEDPDMQHCQWLCWQLRAESGQFISARVCQTIILHLATNYVFVQEFPASVKQRCCSVWVNGISWSSTKGVDVAVQISDNQVIQAVGRSKLKAGSRRLQVYTAKIVQDIIKTISQLSPRLKATPYIIHPYTPTLWKDPTGPQRDSQYLVSAITYCFMQDDDHIPSVSPNTSFVLIDQLFGGVSPLESTVQSLNYPGVVLNGSSESPHNHHSSAPILNELIINQIVVWRVASVWRNVGMYLDIEFAVLDNIEADNHNSVEKACCSMFRKWLSQGPGTGTKPRVWKSVLDAVKEASGKTPAEDIETAIYSLSVTPHHCKSLYMH